MFAWLRDFYRAYFAVDLTFRILFLLVGLPAVTIGMFLSLLYAGEVGEAATALVLVFTSAAIVAFVLWVRHDILAMNRRCEQFAAKKERLDGTVALDDSDDNSLISP